MLSPHPIRSPFRPERPRESVVTRLRRVLHAHFDPADGSAFWLDRARTLGVDPARQIHTIDDLALLGEMTPSDLDRRPLADYVPRRFHRRMDQWVVGQTGGTTGGGTWAAYREDEFVEAFVLPFVSAAAHVGFPARRQWLFVGPSGPHVIGKAVPHLAAALGSPDPFGVDFDPRWAKRLPDGSFARQRYLAHVVAQAMDVIRRQDVGVLFSTPPLLAALAGQMTEAQRLRIAGVHYGGTALGAERLLRFQTESFPVAVHLSGYGNTLFGCAPELAAGPGRQLDYFPFGGRLIFETVDERGAPVAPGELGQVRFTRLDETMLIVRMRERDYAEAIWPPDGAPGEFVLPGLRNPGPRAADAARLAVGLY
jgi:thienamycin biosynthesis protein ThnN